MGTCGTWRNLLVAGQDRAGRPPAPTSERYQLTTAPGRSHARLLVHATSASYVREGRSRSSSSVQAGSSQRVGCR